MVEKRDRYTGEVIEPKMPPRIERLVGPRGETIAELPPPVERSIKVELSSVEDHGGSDVRFQASLQLGDQPMIVSAESPGLALQSLGASLDAVLAGRQWDALVEAKAPDAGHVLLVVEESQRGDVDAFVGGAVAVTARPPRLVVMTRGVDAVPHGVFFRFAIRTMVVSESTTWESELRMRIAARQPAPYLLIENPITAAKHALEEALR